jgi:hypothetical protein
LLIKSELPGREGLLVDRLSQDLKPPLNGALVHGRLEAQTIRRYAEAKERYQAAFPIRGNPGLGPSRLTEPSGQAADAAAQFCSGITLLFTLQTTQK